jgi:hypothetical protein
MRNDLEVDVYKPSDEDATSQHPDVIMDRGRCDRHWPVGRWPVMQPQGDFALTPKPQMVEAKRVYHAVAAPLIKELLAYTCLDRVQ